MRTVTITFPMPPNLANARLHWRAKHSKHVAWKQLAIVQERGLRGRPDRFERVKVTVVFYVGNHPRWIMDWDNCTARLKWCLDLLKECGLIVDDSPKHLTLENPEQRQEAPRRVVLTLEEVA